MSRTWVAVAVVTALLAAACTGEAVLVERQSAEGSLASDEANEGPVLSKGGKKSLNVGAGARSGGKLTGKVGTAKAGVANCATNSDPESGFTASTLKIGTIIPLTGALRPLGEQVARVMKVTVEATMNRQDRIVGYEQLNWGCPKRPGIFGRRVSVDIYSLQANTPEEALAGMRRLIDVENVFLVRDCYLQSNLMGAATQYQNAQGVPGVWCYFSEMPYPALAHWNFAPGVDPLVISAIHTGYLINKLKKRRLAILSDPSLKHNQVAAVRRVAKTLDRPIPSDCIVYKKAQEADNGMRSEIARIRTCYGAATSPDAVIALDALNGTFGALEAQDQGFDTQWSCATCWVESLAELCGDACDNMITDCQALPCVPWASAEKFPAVAALRDTYNRYLSREPEDILTYGPAAITGGIALWLTMTGPDLSRERFRTTLESLKRWDAGIGPILTTSPSDHFGGKSTWLIRFTGRNPWFDDLTGRFITLREVGVPESAVHD
ncbi:MAG: ABC transporter substrate-binding protein [Actinomycetota bacterium]